MRDDPDGWSAAERAELNNHEANGSFKFLSRADFDSEAPGRRLIKLIWVYKKKRNGKMKARLCVQGCCQQPGVDYDQTHCATMRGASLRLLSALAGQHNLKMRRWDFVSAYLQGQLETNEAVYCLPPQSGNFWASSFFCPKLFFAFSAPQGRLGQALHLNHTEKKIRAVF